MYPIYAPEMVQARVEQLHRDARVASRRPRVHEQGPGFQPAAGLGASDRVGGLPAAGPRRRGEVSAMDWLAYLLAIGLVALLWLAAVAFGHDSADGRDWRSDAPDVTEQLR